MAATPEGGKTIEIFNEISEWWGYGLPMLANELNGHKGSVLVKINSIGGDLLQGVAIKNYLKEYNPFIIVTGKQIGRAHV